MQTLESCVVSCSILGYLLYYIINNIYVYSRQSEEAKEKRAEKVTEQLPEDTLKNSPTKDGMDYDEENEELGNYNYKYDEEDNPTTQTDEDNEEVEEYKELNSEEQSKHNLASVIWNYVKFLSFLRPVVN